MRFLYWIIAFKVEPIFEKGVDQASMDEARILLVGTPVMVFTISE